MKIISGMMVALLVSLPAPAQEMGPPRGPRHFERIEQLRKVRLIELLDLKEEQSLRFFARLNEHDKAKEELLDEKNDALDRLERLVRNRGDEADYKKLFDEVHAANDRLNELNESFFESLTDILSTEQRARLLLFERHFAKELREAMMEVQRRRMDGSGR
jgi:Spy/CpxP family protein refolding chaperone